jgi:hypothetical protein
LAAILVEICFEKKDSILFDVNKGKKTFIRELCAGFFDEFLYLLFENYGRNVIHQIYPLVNRERYFHIKKVYVMYNYKFKQKCQLFD